VSILYDSEQRPMKMYFAISLLIHAVLVTVIVIVGVRNVRESHEAITIVLNNEAFMAGEGGTGGDGKTPGSQIKDKEARRKVSKVKERHTRAMPGEIPEAPRDVLSKETEVDNAIPSNESSDLVMLGRPMPANSGFNMQESGAGLGGGGTGIGGYGSGSGFGGIGKGGTGGTGQGRGSGSGEIKDNRQSQYLKEHFHYIREMILKHLTYPPMAKKMGWRGGVTVSFVVSEKGEAESIRITKSSGHKILDENVVDTIKAIQPFPKPPVRARIIIPIVYNLG
jgi:protein TonB